MAKVSKKLAKKPAKKVAKKAASKKPSRKSDPKKKYSIDEARDKNVTEYNDTAANYDAWC